MSWCDGGDGVSQYDIYCGCRSGPHIVHWPPLVSPPNALASQSQRPPSIGGRRCNAEVYAAVTAAVVSIGMITTAAVTRAAPAPISFHHTSVALRA